eukprot:scaffold18752_cov33-Phaeocystis_antarctica.AAC.1
MESGATRLRDVQQCKHWSAVQRTMSSQGDWWRHPRVNDHRTAARPEHKRTLQQQSSILPVAHMLRYCLCFASLLPTVAETRCKARHHLIRVPLLEPAAISCPQIGSAA